MPPRKLYSYDLLDRTKNLSLDMVTEYVAMRATFEEAMRHRSRSDPNMFDRFYSLPAHAQWAGLSAERRPRDTTTT